MAGARRGGWRPCGEMEAQRPASVWGGGGAVASACGGGRRARVEPVEEEEDGGGEKQKENGSTEVALRVQEGTFKLHCGCRLLHSAGLHKINVRFLGFQQCSISSHFALPKPA